jgi:NAD(P)-dependent dehydrogenase (short-subunit alcohol dehydrogenase family)
MKTALITGADRGLGFEFAKKFLDNGDTVFAGKFKTNWLLLEDLKAVYPDTLHIVPLDVRSDESVKKAAAFVKTKTDAIDYLLNVAGVWLDDNTGTVLDGRFNYERMMAQLNVNALGALRATEAFIHLVLNSYEKLVVNISSEAGSIASGLKDTQPGYCMSKAAMNMQAVIVFNAIHALGGNVMNFHPGWMQSVIGSATDDPGEPFRELPTGIRFYMTPERTAASIFELLKNPERFNSEKPAFLNFAGDRMKW